MPSVQTNGDYSDTSSLCPADVADSESDDYGCQSDDARMPFLISKPLDRFKFVRITFLLMGITISLPWCFFVTANDYWMYKFRNVSLSSQDPAVKTELQTTFTSYLVIASSGISILVFAVSPLLAHRYWERKLNYVTLMFTIVLFVVTMVFVNIDTDTWQMTFFAATMIIVVLFNGVGSVFQAAVLSLASLLPPKYIYNNMIGQALAGVIAAVAQIFSLMGDTTPTTSAVFYFGFAIVILVATLVCYVIIHYTPFYKYYMALNAKPMHSPISLVDSCDTPSSFSLWMATARRMWPYLTSIFLVLFVTLSVCPGISVLVVSTKANNPRSLWTGRSFLPLCCFLIVNCADVCGRMVAMWIVPPSSASAFLLVASVLRSVFVPLVMLCNAQPRSHLPVLLDSDSYFVLLMALLGFTNGYLVSLVYVFATRDVPIHFKEMAGSVISGVAALGVLAGSLFCIVLIRLL